MRKYSFSLLYVGLLLASSPFHVQVRNALVGFRGFRFSNYVLLGILAAFFLLAAVRAVRSGKPLEIASLLLALAIVVYFLFQRRIFLNKAFFSHFLHIAEFFILGVLLFKENRRASSPLPFAILLVSAFAVELIQVFIHGRVLDTNDIWINAIAGLVGMVAGYF
ncbi:MAG: VanZ family protein [Candidatus Aminicenantes bacterium]|nr:VanZ family protein [Candidatus Aminicenantes bacterium]